MRHVRSGPQQLDLAHFGSIIDHSDVIDGYVWKGNVDEHGRMSESSSPNANLRDDIPDMMEKLVFGQPLPTSERLALNCMRMVRVNAQEELFVSRSFWMLWLGLRGTPIEKAFADSWPCSGFFHGFHGCRG